MDLEILTNFATVIGSGLVSLLVVWINTRQHKIKADTEITVAELTDQDKFRNQLMDQIEKLSTRLAVLEQQLSECRLDHEKAQIENARLNSRIQTLEAKLQLHQDQFDHSDT
ncbi:MAG: hypothetical protein RKH07_12630 [Gammaproteobacteria bacterium]